MNKLATYLTACLFLGSLLIKAQAPTCGTDVPYFFVDLTGNPDSSWISPGHIRNGNCCGTIAPNRCTSFDVILDPNAAMISFNIASGAVPPGALFYQINCGPEIPVGQPICITGAGPHHISFCKPGNNQNTYVITSIPKPIFPADATVRFGCSAEINTLGMEASSVTWNSVYPGAAGAYNSYLSCTSSCPAPIYTPVAGAPAYIDYQICGFPIADECGFVAVCDTVRIYNVAALAASVSPAGAAFCAGGGGVLLTASATGGDGVYSYIWKDSDGLIVGTGATYNATTEDNFTLEVQDGLYDPSLCPPVLLNVPVIVGLPPVVNAGPDQTVCASAPTAHLAATVSNATGGVWTGGLGTFNPSATSLTPTYTPSAAELAAGSVTLTFTSTGAGGGCSDASDALTITYPPLLSVSLSSVSVLCNGSMATLTPSVSGGAAPYSYDWNSGSSASSITVGAGNYCVSITDLYGCAASVCANVTVPSALLLSMSSTDATTIGGSDGTATATVSGGTAPYTYVWSPGGQTTATANSLSYGIHSVTVTDANGCSISLSTVVNDPQCLNLQTNLVASSNVACFNGTTGTANATVTGGTPPYTYSWNTTPVQTSSSVSGLGAGVYLLTVTDATGCIDVTGMVITQPAQLVNVMNHTNVTTVGGNNGTASANPSGGTPPYNYVWSNGATAVNVSGLSEGTYTVTVTDNAGCSLVDSVPVYGPACASVVVNVYSTNVSCHGGADGSVTAEILFGVPPYSYLWSNGATTPTATGLTAGVYTLTATGAMLCPLFATVTITEPATLSLGLAPTNIACAPVDNGTIDLSVTGGTFPYSYTWSNGINVEDQTLLTDATYSVTVTDAHACTATASAVITRPAVLSASATGTNVTCYDGTNGAVDAAAAGGITPYAYSWSNGVSTQDLTGLSSGEYLLTVTDANGCNPSAPLSMLIDEPEMVSLDSSFVSCPVPGSGVAAVSFFSSGGNGGPYQVSYNNGSSFLAAGDYTEALPVATSYYIVVKDGNGCSSLVDTIVVAPAVSVTGTIFSSCFTTATTTTTVTVVPAGGAMGPYQISYNNGASFGSTGTYTADLPIAASYMIIAQDALGCPSVVSPITIPDVLSASLVSPEFAGGYHISCYDAATGSINLTASGGTAPYAYAWTGPSGFASSSQNLSGLIAGTYNVTITDASGCILTKTITLVQPAQLTASLFSPDVAGGYNVTCNGVANGSIELSVTGGAPGYSFAWAGPTGFAASTEDLSALAAGTYTVTVTDANACSVQSSITLTQPMTFSGSLSSAAYNGGNNISCNGNADGSVTLSLSGGTLPYTYSWSNGAVTADLSGLAAGSYSLMVTDVNGCTFTDNITLTEPALLNASLSASSAIGYHISCNGNTDGNIDLTVTGGTAPYIYAWTGTATAASEDLSSLGTGTYSVSVTDDNGCNVNASMTLTEPPVLTVALSSDTVSGGYNISCNGSSDGNISCTANGGTAGYAYAWSGPSGFSSAAEDLSAVTAGAYALTVTDTNGCSVMGNITLTEPAALVATGVVSEFNGNSISCNGGNDGSINLSVTGGSPAYSYSWTGPSGYVSNLEDLNALLAGTYSVNVTDANECTAGISFVLTEPAMLSATISSIPATCALNNGTADLSIIGGTTPYAQIWSNGATTEDLTGLAAGVYHVVITDANGCLHYDTTSVGEIPLLSIASEVNDMLCYGSQDGAVELSCSLGTTPYTYAWSNGATGSSLNGLASGSYSVTVTDASGCTVTADFTIVETAPLILSMTSTQYTGGFNISNYQGSDGMIDLSVSGGSAPYAFAWSNGVITEDQAGLTEGTYTVTVTDSLGCTALAETRLTAPLELVMPTGFSPNGDGKNDLFVIHGIEIYPDNELVIFNRWGNIVKEFSGYQNEWDGSANNGELLPNATYFAILTIKGKEIILKGYVDLRK